MCCIVPDGRAWSPGTPGRACSWPGSVRAARSGPPPEASTDHTWPGRAPPRWDAQNNMLVVISSWGPSRGNAVTWATTSDTELTLTVKGASPGCHHDEKYHLFPHHAPEVTKCFWQRTWGTDKRGHGDDCMWDYNIVTTNNGAVVLVAHPEWRCRRFSSCIRPWSWHWCNRMSAKHSRKKKSP